jgi:tetratricopeptide (TPR) repeat protein
MTAYERFESDPDEYLSRDLLDIREMVEERPLALRSKGQQIEATLRRGLTSEYHYFSAVETVFYLLTIAIADPEAKPWFEPILDFIDQRPVADGRLFDIGFQQVMPGFRDLIGVYADPTRVRSIIVDDLLQAYIKLIRLLVYKPDLHVPPTLFDQALGLVKRLGDHVEKDRLYQAIALYSAHNGEFETAERYAVLAYNDAEFIDDPERIVDAACTLAIVYRVGERMTKADYYIHSAMRKEAAKVPNIRFATLFYENGTSCYRHDRFEQARSYYEQARVLFEANQATYQIAMTKHALSMTELHLRNFDEAEALLLAARSAWEQIGNDFEWVNSFFVEADLELKRGNRLLGIQIMRRTIDMAYSRLAETAARDFLIERIQEHIEKHS